MDFQRIAQDTWSNDLGRVGLILSVFVCVTFIFRDRIPMKRKNPPRVERGAVREKRMKHYCTKDLARPSNPSDDTRTAPAHETSDSAPFFSNPMEHQPQPTATRRSSVRVAPPPVSKTAALDESSIPVLRLRGARSLPLHDSTGSNPANENRTAPAHGTSVSAPASSDPTEQQSQSTAPRRSSAPADSPAKRVLRLPGEMEVSQLLEILEAGPNAAYENLTKISAVKASKDSPGTIPGICRSWWEAATTAGRMDLAIVAADALGLHLESLQDDLFSNASEGRASVLLEFLRESPQPTMVRHVFKKNPAAGRAAIHLVCEPLRIEKDARNRGRAAIVDFESEAAERLDSWQPLSGFEKTEGVLRSPAGSIALAITLGFEAAEEYGYGAEFEKKSVLGPLLGAFSGVLSLGEHLEAARSGLMMQGFQYPHSSTPVAHQLARSSLELSSGRSLVFRGHANQFRDMRARMYRNRQCLVDVIGHSLIQAMTTKGVIKEAKAGVVAWLRKVIDLHESLPGLCADRNPELLGEPRSSVTCASSAFLMSFSSLLLRLGSERFSSINTEILEAVSLTYVDEGPIQWAQSKKLRDVLDDSDSEEEEGKHPDHGRRKPGQRSRGEEGAQDMEGSFATDSQTLGAEETKETSSLGSEARAGGESTGSSKKERVDPSASGLSASSARQKPQFSLATDLFFLTHRSLKVIIAPLYQRFKKMMEAMSDAADRAGVSTTTSKQEDWEVSEEASAGGAGNPFGSPAMMKRVYTEALTAVRYGWHLEGFGTEAVAGLTCQFAMFTAAWLRFQIERYRGSVSQSLQVGGKSSLSESGGQDAALMKILPALIETTCDGWIRGVHVSSRLDRLLTMNDAVTATRFCGAILEQARLRLSAVTQSKLVDVLEALLSTGPQAESPEYRRGRSGGFLSSMYWGKNRGYAGVVIDDGELRRLLPRQLMMLYGSVQSIEGVAVEIHLGYFKFGVRERVGRIILHLWGHPLGESRAAILEVIRASIKKSSSIADNGRRGRDGMGNAGGSTGHQVATDFFIGTYDMITYCFEDAMERVKDGTTEEKSNGGRALRVGHPHWQKYQGDRKQSMGMFRTCHSALKLLVTLSNEDDVRSALRAGVIGKRSAALIAAMLHSLFAEDSVEYALAKPSEWGFDKVKLGGLACQLLAYLADPGIIQAQVMAEMLHEAYPEFDARLVQAAAATEGGRPLLGEVGTRLSLALEVAKWKAHAAEIEAALKAGGGAEAAENPFRSLEGKVDAAALEEAYGTAMEDLGHQQVESLSPGHFYDRRREGCSLANPKRVSSELFRKLPRMLPSPPHPDSAVFVLIDEEALNFARFVISGPVDTPYEGGLFVFDVFLPLNYPVDPPMVAMVTTGQGTVKFNVNLYADGKVCLSILGTGTSSSGGEKWNADKSSLWQVFASIQTLVLVKDPYYNEGGGRSNMRGRGTAETEKASADENARITLETIRHAAVGNIRNPPKGCEELVKTHFRVTRGRMLLRCKEACENAPNERLRKATLKASRDLRLELDRLTREGGGDGGDGSEN